MSEELDRLCIPYHEDLYNCIDGIVKKTAKIEAFTNEMDGYGFGLFLSTALFAKMLFAYIKFHEIDDPHAFSEVIFKQVSASLHENLMDG